MMRVSDSTPAFAAAYTATSGMVPVLAAVELDGHDRAVVRQPGRERLEQEEHRAEGSTPVSRSQSASRDRVDGLARGLAVREDHAVDVAGRGRPGRPAQPRRVTSTPHRLRADRRDRRQARVRPRAAPTTDAPRSTSSRAVARPIPEPAPVTTIRRPANSSLHAARAQYIRKPPEALIVAPVMYFAWSDARNTTGPAISSGSAT